MCLTEPQAGSDLGAVRTRAALAGEGTWQVTGSKIFIWGCDHDLSDNIAHLVLCRLPDAPAGSKGLSLIHVPKVLPDGERNALLLHTCCRSCRWHRRLRDFCGTESRKTPENSLLSDCLPEGQPFKINNLRTRR